MSGQAAVLRAVRRHGSEANRVGSHSARRRRSSRVAVVNLLMFAEKLSDEEISLTLGTVGPVEEIMPIHGVQALSVIHQFSLVEPRSFVAQSGAWGP